MRPLELVKPFLAILPDVQQAEIRQPFKIKALYTATALFVFLVCSQLPLYGIKSNSSQDPFFWARVIMASNRCDDPAQSNSSRVAEQGLFGILAFFGNAIDIADLSMV